MTAEQEKLVIENRNLRYKVINDMNIMFREDDLLDLCDIGLCKAALTYKPESNVKFSSYAYKCIKNEIIVLLKFENTQKKIKNENIVSYDVKTTSLDSDGKEEIINNCNLFSNEECGLSIVEIKELFRNIFSDSEINYKLAVYLIIDGMKLVDAKEKLGLDISHQAVQQRRNTILRRLSKLREMI